MPIPIRVAVVAAAVVSLVAFGTTLGELAGGIAEVPGHWWSSLSAAAGVASVTVAVVVEGRARRRPEPS